MDDVTGDLMMRGMVYCQKDIALRVDKWFEYDADHSPLRVRCFRFAYIGWQIDGNRLLKYHNLHADPNDYVHRVYNPETGKQILYERLQRYQFPTFPEVLDELEYLAQRL